METARLLNLAGLLLCFAAVAQSEGMHKNNIKYILIWSGPTLYPTDADTFGDGASAFIEHKCADINCFVTRDGKLLKDVTDYDVIVFNGRELDSNVPDKRLARQKYAYVSTESSHYYPVCETLFDDFFNWTWTYKLNSDIWWGYIRVYDLNGTVVGPKSDMHWSELGAVDKETKVMLQNKSVAAAWFVSNCYGKSGRSKFVQATAKELEKHGHSIHIYGYCGTYRCPRSTPEVCNKMIAKDYFFYLAFENSFAEDYVTEKVLTGLRNYAVPVVFGEANYSRFLPPGSYLDARALGPEGLALRMASIIRSYQLGQPEDYYNFFRWRSRYIINETTNKKPICKLCSDLNKPEIMSKQTIYKNFTYWWNSKYAKCNAQHAKAERVEESVMVLHILIVRLVFALVF